MSDYRKFSERGFLRLSQIIKPDGPLPISKSTWWAGVKSGRFPQSVKLGPGTTAWRERDIAALLAELDRFPETATNFVSPASSTSKAGGDTQ
jgi:prophage regulatory protein